MSTGTDVAMHSAGLTLLRGDPTLVAEAYELSNAISAKLRQNLFRMLREADLISDQQQIQSAIPSPALAALLAQRGQEALLVFPATDNEIQRWLQ